MPSAELSVCAAEGWGVVEYTVRAAKRTFVVTQEQVTAALSGVTPERIRRHAVCIGGVLYPVKQAFAAAFGVAPEDFYSQDARRAFWRLGFPLLVPLPSPPDGPEATRILEWERLHCIPEEDQVLQTGPILLEWYRWCRWPDLAVSEKSPDSIPIPTLAGVYEVRLHGEEPRLYIGRASNLERRIKQDLIRGYHIHPAGPAIRRSGDTSRVEVRWADTERPAAAEEELHRLHVQRFGAHPKYTQRT
jgi:hypothetical protein